ncbi:hypothetical protein CUMW_217030 [Citrus unshiu]|uniref:Protein kinase domain-containing protein n=1 Tax=Citrus unshiu TaxID=55188 RepID=A0A2H5QCP3_CITUN|nr:hypothetical protein CUMW_217030 [Citrus unshiu]
MAICNTCSSNSPLLLSFFTITISFCLTIIPLASALTFNYTSFSPQYDDNITYERAYPDSNRVIQLPANRETAGRATYNQSMRLWDKATGNLTDFTTHFSFVIDSGNRSYYADGLAFFLAPQGSKIPTNKGGGSFGLTKDNEPLNSSIPFVAVEFDVYVNSWDPTFSHVGIDINSVQSKKNVYWSSDVKSGRRNEAWISYNSSTHNLSVAFTGFRNNLVVMQGLDYQVDLRQHLPEFVTFGFSMATGVDFAIFSIYSWEFNSSLEMDDETTNPVSNPKRRRKNRTALVVGLSLGGGKLGQGGFGGVYKGFFRETNSYIAVKRVSQGSKQGIKEYASEVKIISRLRHRNLVQLLGWCHEKKELLLVYEFMPNGSLDSHLFKENSLLTWEFRYKIAQDLASGLLYLQEEWEQCVVHRDIKSSNIMLDSNFNAKIGDFGLARLVEHAKGSQTTVLAGTMGYMAPECATTGKASKESDVYSFGIVALEIACGRKPINPKAPQGQVSLLQWVWDLYGNGKLLEAVDPRLCRDFDGQQIERLMIVGLWCAHPDENLRPSIRQVIHVLNFEAPLPALPPKMPVPTYLSPPVNMLTIYSTDSNEGQNQRSSSSYSYNTITSQSTSSSVASSSAALLNTR